MEALLNKLNKILEIKLDFRSRVILVVAALCLAPTLFFPLWNMTFWSYQYPEGLELYIYSHKLDSGDDGNDITEINILNHYIGMAPLEEEDFLELKWIPLGIGIFFILTLRAAAFGVVHKVIDVLVLFSYFGLFGLWSFYYKLNFYGHDLDPRAAVTIEPFTPPLFGFEQVGQFKVWSYPDVASYFLFAFALLVSVAIILPVRRSFKNGEI